MARRVEIISSRIAYQKAIFKIEEVTLRHERYDGQMTQTLTRLNLERGDAVAAVIHRTDTDEIVFTEQFRYPTYSKDTGWLLEIPAGMVRPSEEPRDAMRRELVEEIGYDVKHLHYISSFFLSPGGSSERIHLFYVATDHRSKTHSGGGVAYEGENIATILHPIAKIPDMLAKYEITDAKSIIGLQWLLMNRDNLKAIIGN